MSTPTHPSLQSLLAGRWHGAALAQLLKSAIKGRSVASTHAESPDFAEALHHARTVGLPALLKRDFQQRAATLKALAKVLGEHKEQRYAWSAHTSATRNDGWVASSDILTLVAKQPAKPAPAPA